MNYQVIPISDYLKMRGITDMKAKKGAYVLRVDNTDIHCSSIDALIGELKTLIKT